MSWSSEELETLSEPVRVTGEEVRGPETEAEVVLGPEWGDEGRAGMVRVRLKEEEAVLRAKLGSDDDEGALCRGVVGALMLPPPPPP